MLVEDFARHVYKLLEERRSDIIEYMASGAPDWASYQKLVGEIQGLDRARDEIRTLLERNDDDEFDTS